MLAVVASMGETIVAALAGLGGAALGGWVSLRATSRQIDAQKEKDAQEKRGAERGAARLLGSFLEGCVGTVAFMLDTGYWSLVQASPPELPNEDRRRLLDRVTRFEAVVAAEDRAMIVRNAAAGTHGKVDEDGGSSRAFLEASYRILHDGLVALADAADSAEWALIPDDHAEYMTYVGERGVREARTTADTSS